MGTPGPFAVQVDDSSSTSLQYQYGSSEHYMYYLAYFWLVAGHSLRTLLVVVASSSCTVTDSLSGHASTHKLANLQLVASLLDSEQQNSPFSFVNVYVVQYLTIAPTIFCNPTAWQHPHQLPLVLETRP